MTEIPMSASDKEARIQESRPLPLLPLFCERKFSLEMTEWIPFARTTSTTLWNLQHTRFKQCWKQETIVGLPDRWRILFDGSSSYSSILSWSCNGGVVRVGPVGLSVTSSSHGGIAFSVLFFKYASGGTPVGRTLAVWWCTGMSFCRRRLANMLELI